VAVSGLGPGMASPNDVGVMRSYDLIVCQGMTRSRGRCLVCLCRRFRSRSCRLAAPSRQGETAGRYTEEAEGVETAPPCPPAARCVSLGLPICGMPNMPLPPLCSHWHHALALGCHVLTSGVALTGAHTGETVTANADLAIYRSASVGLTLFTGPP
jgi:hypothetical protein